MGDDRGAVEGNSRGSNGGECNEPTCDPRYLLHPERGDRGRIVRPNARRWRRNRRCVPAKRHLSLGRRSRFVRLELRTQCDRSAVGVVGHAVPRVARLLAALGRARPTAISSTAPRSRARRARPTAIESTAPQSRTRLRATHGYFIARSAVVPILGPAGRSSRPTSAHAADFRSRCRLPLALPRLHMLPRPHCSRPWSSSDRPEAPRWLSSTASKSVV